MFESIVGEAQKKLNLGEKAGGLLSTLLALMVNKADGGFSGFLERFIKKSAFIRANPRPNPKRNPSVCRPACFGRNFFAKLRCY